MVLAVDKGLLTAPKNTEHHRRDAVREFQSLLHNKVTPVTAH